jgi:membrane-associated phospholipid phosphatase
MKLLKANSFFSIAWILYLVVCICILLFSKQGDSIRFFSENRIEFWDVFFKYGTKLGEEVAYLFIVVLLLFVGYGKAIITGLTGIIVMFLSYPLKQLFSHPRPKLFFKNLGELKDLNLVEGVELHNHFTSFPSGHTMSAFALYGLLSFMFYKNKPKFAAFLFFPALIVALSRVYLVQHFVKDVFFGGLIGYMIGLVMYLILQRLEQNKNMVKRISIF